MAKKRAAAKKVAKKKTARKPAVTTKKKAAGRSVKLKSAGNAKVDPAQKSFEGMEEPKITGIETGIKRMLAISKEVKSLNEEDKEVRGKVLSLLIKNDLHSYKYQGKEVYQEPGSPVLKIKTVKKQG